jgi:hypothetical protein
MSEGRTTWRAKPCGWRDRERVVALGEEFGPAGPLILDLLEELAKEQRANGAVRTGLRSLARGAFLPRGTDGAQLARSILEFAETIHALDDLAIADDADMTVTCRVSGFAADQGKGYEAVRKGQQRAAGHIETPPDNVPGSPDARDNGAACPDGGDTVPVSPPTGQDRTGEEPPPVAASGDLPVSIDKARDRLKAEVVDRVWTAYVDTRLAVLGNRAAPKRTDARSQLIARRLREWPEDEVVAAVKGWRHFPHNRGENERNQPYCDIELLLRDAAHIEKFRDAELASGGPGRRGDGLTDDEWKALVLK